MTFGQYVDSMDCAAHLVAVPPAVPKIRDALVAARKAGTLPDMASCDDLQRWVAEHVGPGLDTVALSFWTIHVTVQKIELERQAEADIDALMLGHVVALISLSEHASRRDYTDPKTPITRFQAIGALGGAMRLLTADTDRPLSREEVRMISASIMKVNHTFLHPYDAALIRST
jgi:hypothetical protein